MYKILVCGGRNYTDYTTLSKVLNSLAERHSENYHPLDNWLPTDILIIHGGAKGADSLADKWAVNHFAQIKEYPAEWETYGKAAGPIRNKYMLLNSEPDIVVAFPGGRGTAHMIKTAKNEGYNVLIIDEE